VLQTELPMIYNYNLSDEEGVLNNKLTKEAAKGAQHHSGRTKS
jgi:hypothetical protein